VKLPRDLSGRALAQQLTRYGYRITRQKGSHLRLTTLEGGEHHVAIPAHDSLRVGTLATILGKIAAHRGTDRATLARELFER